MGAIQEQTQELGPFVVELRSESFWVSRNGTIGDAADANKEPATLTIPAGDLPALLAALAMGIERGTLPTGNSSAAWSVSRTEDAVAIAGPWALVARDSYPDEPDRYDRVAGELKYADAPALMMALQS